MTDDVDFTPKDIYCPACGELYGPFRPHKPMTCDECDQTFQIDMNPQTHD